MNKTVNKLHKLNTFCATQYKLIAGIIWFCLAVSIIFFTTVGVVTSITDNVNELPIEAHEETVEIIASIEYYVEPITVAEPTVTVIETKVITIETVAVTPDVVDEVVAIIAEPTLELYSVKPEIKIHTILVDDVEINIDSLMNCYYSNNMYGTMNRCDDATINTCINFFCEQLNISPEIAAGIIGNVCVEGHFGEEQGTHTIAVNVEEYIDDLLSKNNKGYGIAQWTYEDRQENLIEQIVEVIDYLMTEYNATYEEVVYGEYYPTAIVLSELIYMYKELQCYNIFSSLTDYYTLEDATGRVALSYERYKNSKKHWKYDENGYCTLIGTENSSGAKRLNFAKYVYGKLTN